MKWIDNTEIKLSRHPQLWENDMAAGWSVIPVVDIIDTSPHLTPLPPLPGQSVKSACKINYHLEAWLEEKG